MNSDYEKIIRDSYSEKMDAPEEYQEKLINKIKQAQITVSQSQVPSGGQPVRQNPVYKFFHPDSGRKNFLHTSKIPVIACLSLACGICACLGLAMNLYVKKNAAPEATESAVMANGVPETKQPANTKSPLETELPWETINPEQATVDTHTPGQKPKNETGTAQAKNTSNANDNDDASGNKKDATARPEKNVTAKPHKTVTAKPKKTTTSKSPELAQVKTSNAPEIIENPEISQIPETTGTPASISTPQLTNSPKETVPPDTPYPLGTVLPADTPTQTDGMPTVQPFICQD